MVSRLYGVTFLLREFEELLIRRITGMKVQLEFLQILLSWKLMVSSQATFMSRVQ